MATSNIILIGFHLFVVPNLQNIKMTTNERVRIGNLKIVKILFDFVNQEVLPDTNINQDTFWFGVESIITELLPKNHKILQKRDDLQVKIDEWHRTHQGKHTDIDVYKSFLFDIGYLSARNNNENFQINTTNVDDEIAIQPAPQLVVPLMNARFTLNAVNARWGSLYDALYGTDVISESNGCKRTKEYNKKRGEKVIDFTRQFLDQSIPLANNYSHIDAMKYSIENGELKVRNSFKKNENFSI
jgi:malate synthase